MRCTDALPYNLLLIRLIRKKTLLALLRLRSPYLELFSCSPSPNFAAVYIAVINGAYRRQNSLLLEAHQLCKAQSLTLAAKLTRY